MIQKCEDSSCDIALASQIQESERMTTMIIGLLLLLVSMDVSLAFSTNRHATNGMTSSLWMTTVTQSAGIRMGSLRMLPEKNDDREEHHGNTVEDFVTSSRRDWMRDVVLMGSTTVTTAGVMLSGRNKVEAAPPIAIMAQELGYFPVSNAETGQVMYVPAQIARHSSEDALTLAQHLKEKKIAMYGAYWCPHCYHQRQVLGKEALSQITYVECSPKGYKYAGPKVCEDVSGFPMWKNTVTGKFVVNGEASLQQLAEQTGYRGSIKDDPTVPGLSGSCR